MKRVCLTKMLDIPSCKGENRILAFTMLRFAATCLITNTHYNEVYPISALAVGGLLGDVFFFVVSGFVLGGDKKQGFFPWYGKRLLRIYPTIFAGVALFLLTGYQNLERHSLFEAFVFPTFFVFVAAIVTLYIPYYFVSRAKSKRTWLLTFGAVLLGWLAVYGLLLDKSVYRMNAVTNPIILFPYFLAMLTGGFLRRFGVKKRGRGQLALCWGAAPALCLVYFAANNVIRGNAERNGIQILVPMTLLVAAASVSVLFYLLEGWFQSWPDWLTNAIGFVAALTLEIYVVQRPIIDALAWLPFPLNWVLITASILGAAVVMRLTVNLAKTALICGVRKITGKNNG